MMTAALVYLTRLGFAGFPVHTPTAGRCSCGNADCQHPGKHPRTSHGHLDATKDPAQIRRSWGRWPDANIGIATGEVSNIFVLDIDPRHGGDETLRELERQHGELPHTARQITGSLGTHILFQHVPGIRNSAGRLGPGLDIRGEGGFIVAAPSLHLSGRRYAWDVDHHPLEAPIAAAPQWLIDLAHEPTAPNGARAARPAQEWATMLSEPCPEGQRNATLAKLAGYLFRKWVEADVVAEISHLWSAARCRPPLDDDEIRHVITSIYGRELKRRGEADGH